MLTKDKLYELVQNSTNIPNDIKNISKDELIKLMFYWNHLTSDCIAGKRLTPTGYTIFSSLYTPYEYENDAKVFKGKWIIVLSKMLKYPWYCEKGIVAIFDIKIYCEIKLKNSFSKYMDSITTKKYF